MSLRKKVSDLNPGDEGVIDELIQESCSHLQLQEMGILPGRRLRLTRKAPTGAPCIIDVQGCSFVLSKQDASSVLVRLQ